MLNTASVTISWRRAGVRCERPSSATEVAVRIAREARARQQRGVVQRGVVELVGEDRVVAPEQRGEHAEVGHVAGGKQQRRAGWPTNAQAPLERRVRRSVAGDQVRRAGADAVALGAFAQRGDDARIGGEAEIVVAAEGRRRAAVDRHAARPARPAPARARTGRRHASRRVAVSADALMRAGSAPRAHAVGEAELSHSSAWSASASGLPVVSSLSP